MHLIKAYFTSIGSKLASKINSSNLDATTYIHPTNKVFAFKGKWQQKINSSRLREIKKCIEVDYKIFIIMCFTSGDILRAVARTLIERVSIHIFMFCPTSFFSN